MSQNDNKCLVVKKAMKEKILECRQNLAEFTSNSENELQKIDMKLKALENELASCNVNTNEDYEELKAQHEELQNDFNARQKRELLILITLIQIDKFWAKEESEVLQHNDSEKENDQVPQECLCLKFIEELETFLDSLGENESMDPIAKYLESMGVIENYEFKLLAITPDDSNFSDEVHKEINSLNAYINNLFYNTSTVESNENDRADYCKCQGLKTPHFCKMKSKHANKFRLSSVICNIVSNRLDCGECECESEAGDSKFDKNQDGSTSNNLNNTNVNASVVPRTSHQSINIENENNKTEIGKQAETMDSNLNVDDRTHPDDAEISKENISAVPIHEDISNESKEKTTDNNKTICGLCKGFKATKTSQITDEIEKKNSEAVVIDPLSDLKIPVEPSIKSIQDVYFEKELSDKTLKSLDNISAIGLIVLRELTDNILLLKWDISNNEDLIGYEIQVEDFITVLKSPSKGLTFIKTKNVNSVNSDNSIFLRCIKNEI